MWLGGTYSGYALLFSEYVCAAAAVGYVSLNEDGKLVFDNTKADEFLEATAKLFLDILDAEDRLDGAFLEKVRSDMEAAEKAPIVAKLVGDLFVKA